MTAAALLDLARDGASALFLTGGAFFVVIGAIGIVRLPDFYTRLHAAGVTDTLGAELILMGLLLQCDHWLVAAKIVLIGLFLFFTSPTATHALAHAAYTAGLVPWRKKSKDGEPAP